MGIKGLLPLLKSIQKPCNLKKFAGQTLGVDAYGWLHRGVVGCAFALALDKPTSVHIDFVLSRVRMLLDFGVTPYLIFDGDNLPSKAGTNAARRKRREESKALALELQKAGKTSQAQQEFQKAIDVTPFMARQLIEELKKLNVQYVVAPYEADAQLVYLEQKGIIDGILSEDSDLLVFGARRLLTKLNQYGELVEIDRADFPMCKEMNLAGWTDSMFMRMAILSGCDYLPNIGKIGLKTAHAYVRRHKDIEKIIRVIQFEGKLMVPADYSKMFEQAELTFLHHRVFCPIAQKMVCLKELSPGMLEEDMPYLGPFVNSDTATGVACGDLDPFSKKPIHVQPRNGTPVSRPALGENRRQSYATPADLKPEKSIETFFKPQRQPLAELDPNSLTPSPSQQRLLERHRNESWEPRLVSSAPALRRGMTTPAQISAGTDRTAFLARASTKSTYQPPKRQRLCAESVDPSPIQETKQSPFFTSTFEQVEVSPLAEKKAKVKKSRRSAFEVFSDSSVGEMLLDGEVQQKASPQQEVIYQHPTYPDLGDLSENANGLDSIPQSSPPAQPALSGSTPSQEGISPSRRCVKGDDARNGSQARELSQDDDPEAFEDLLDFHVRKQNEAILQKFAFTPSQKPAMRSLSSPKGKQMAFSAQPEVVQMAALSKLFTEDRVPEPRPSPDLRETFAHQSPEARQSALKSLSADVATPGRILDEGVPKRSAVLSPPMREHSPSITRNEVRGSEDAMVPNSEDECSEVGSPIRKPTFDLSSFAFVRA
ncbi:exonuclease 1 [Exophiala viscosa]|uniref:exonuclease 1 n=1 Tax=Exophiala viscosa TaxID=2486360 RepID=UPI00218CE8E6|nr:exonuclease 1 [Exophiala viscosa]